MASLTQAELDNMRFLATKHDGEPHISRVPSSYLAQAANEIERLNAKVELQRKQINRLRRALAPFARNYFAVSLSDALGQVTREDLIQAAEVLAATTEHEP